MAAASQFDLVLKIKKSDTSRILLLLTNIPPVLQKRLETMAVQKQDLPSILCSFPASFAVRREQFPKPAFSFLSPLELR
jgi:hypothetical protein